LSAIDHFAPNNPAGGYVNISRFVDVNRAEETISKISDALNRKKRKIK
jgi:hypothetical protein